MESKDFCCFEFDEFQLDARRRALSKNGENVPLSARNFDLLLFMVENGGRILEHDELLEKVWAGTFVEQATLKKGISALRQILAEKSANEFIKTIPRRGYSFVSPVRTVPENREILFVRETKREILVEEFEETCDEDENFEFSDEPIVIPATELKSLPAANPKKNRFARAAIFCGAGIVITVLILLGLKPFISKSAAPQFSIENVRVSRITNNGKVLAGTAVSPDGNYLLYSAGDKEGVSLWVRQMSANSVSRLTAPVAGGFWGYAFAPDNSYVYYILNNQNEPHKSGLYKIPLLGGEPRRIKENVSTIAVSPDGNRLALIRLNDKTNIFTVNSDGEDERAVTSFEGETRLWGLSWTPDGKSLVGTIRKTLAGKPLYYISEISPEDGKETLILPAQEKIIFGAVWLPDKSAMLMTMREPNADIRQIWQYFPDSGDWRRVTNDNNSYKYVNLTRDGKTIVTSQESRFAAIWVTDGLTLDNTTPEKKSLLNNANNFRQITDGVSNFDRLGWLSGNRLMYSTTEGGKETILTINADGANARQVTNGDDGIWISPNAVGGGRSICFISSRTGSKQVWRIDGDGKNLTNMTQTNSPVVAARILRDNSTVIYKIQQPEGMLLFEQTGNGQTTRLTDSDTGLFAVSADEKLLAVEILDQKTGKYYVELRSLIDGKTIKIFNFLPRRQMSFTPGDKSLAYESLHGDCVQIMMQPLDGGEPFALTDFQTEDIFSFDWSPDGSRFAVIRGKQLNDAVLIKTAVR